MLSNIQQQIIEQIIKERQRQDEKWGEPSPNHNPFIWQTILTEETGEAAKEVLSGVNHIDKLKTELIQVAAVAIAWLESIAANETENDG